VKWIALLRAVNVGGRRVSMAAVRELITDLGGGDVRTLLQSGNAVFALAGRRDSAPLEQRLEAEAQRRFGFAVAFMLRSAAQWRALVDANPFPDRARQDPARLVLVAFKSAPAAAAVAALQAGHRGPETMHIRGSEGWFVYPEGMGRSKLTNALIERRLGVACTARNWNTVLGLAALAGD
jgi:uncharacterized protein (DUF1697 family)